MVAGGSGPAAAGGVVASVVARSLESAWRLWAVLAANDCCGGGDGSESLKFAGLVVRTGSVNGGSGWFSRSPFGGFCRLCVAGYCGLGSPVVSGWPCVLGCRFYWCD